MGLHFYFRRWEVQAVFLFILLGVNNNFTVSGGFKIHIVIDKN
jgi:hypothetical protein